MAQKSLHFERRAEDSTLRRTTILDIYLYLQGEKRGPYTKTQLQTMWSSRDIAPFTHYWHEGMTERAPIAALLADQSDIPFLVDALGAPSDKGWISSISARENDVAEVLYTLGWYPDAKKRVEIATRAWHLGTILGFPEAIDPAVKAFFKDPRERGDSRGPDNPLRNTIPHSSLSPEIADLIVVASSYESHIKAFQFWDRYYTTEESDAAVEQLCRLVSPVTSNILHLVKDKSYRDIPMSDDDGRSWEDRVDFPLQRTLAEKELERRGNPPYRPEAYLKD